jgi:hypothetical protein
MPTRPQATIEAYNTQTTIGWHQFARGRIAIEWGNAINEHLARQTWYSFNAEHWGSKILSINWKYILQLWMIRNTEVHGNTAEKTEYIK